MATKPKSIIEEALLEAKSLEDALKANTKEMLATHMKQEIEHIVESSLKEQDEELIDDIEIGSDEELEVPAGDVDIADLEIDIEAGDDSIADAGELELDLDLDADFEGAEDEEEAVELDVIDLPIDLDLGDDSELDLTGAPDDEVLAVFKKMGDEDEVEVIKDEDGIHLTDNETGAEYYIKESEDLNEDGLCEDCGDDVVYEIEMDEHQSFPDRRKEKRSMDKYWGDTPDDFKKHLSHSVQGYNDRMDDSLEEDDEELYEGGMYTDDQGGEDYPNFKDTDPGYDGTDGSSHGEQGGKDFGRKGRSQKTRHEHEEHLEEDKIQSHQYPRKSGAKVGSDQASPYGGTNESRKSRRSISERRKPKNVRKVTESKIVKEYNELKSKNEEYKKAHSLFREKLNEVAVFNSNLAYTTKLFTEHTTTKKEKLTILSRFDEVNSLKESKSLYKKLASEVGSNKPIHEAIYRKGGTKVISEGVGNNKNKVIKENKVYQDPQMVRMMDLMNKIK